MGVEDCDEVRGLWSGIEGVVLTPSDDRSALGYQLRRNKGLSLVARDDENHFIGAVLCGFDREGTPQALGRVGVA